MEKNIKDYREKELKTFVLGNILLFLVITGVINDIASLIGEDNLWKAIAELFESSILSSIVYIFVFVFDSKSGLKWGVLEKISALKVRLYSLASENSQKPAKNK